MDWVTRYPMDGCLRPILDSVISRSIFPGDPRDSPGTFVRHLLRKAALSWRRQRRKLVGTSRRTQNTRAKTSKKTKSGAKKVTKRKQTAVVVGLTAEEKSRLLKPVRNWDERVSLLVEIWKAQGVKVKVPGLTPASLGAKLRAAQRANEREARLRAKVELALQRLGDARLRAEHEVWKSALDLYAMVRAAARTDPSLALPFRALRRSLFTQTLKPRAPARRPHRVHVEKNQHAERRVFAAVLPQELGAVRAAVSVPWSNGQTEGQVNKLQWLKRPKVRSGPALGCFVDASALLSDCTPRDKDPLSLSLSSSTRALGPSSSVARGTTNGPSRMGVYPEIMAAMRLQFCGGFRTLVGRHSQGFLLDLRRFPNTDENHSSL